MINMTHVVTNWWYLSVNTTINKNKRTELLTLVLFDGCYAFRSACGTIFRQSHQIRLLSLNWPNMDPYWCYSSQSYSTCKRHQAARNFLILIFFRVFAFLFRIVSRLSPGVLCSTLCNGSYSRQCY
jgi:hypothetical protein